jgi:glycosyltransferase involved in cell wall biosynthesis
VETLLPVPADVSSQHGDSRAIEPLRCSGVLTHHWLVRRRGGERVLEALCELLPDSAIYTLVYDPSGFQNATGRHSEGAKRPRNLAPPEANATSGAPSFQGWGTRGRRIITSFLQWIPGAKQHYPKLLPLMPLAARRIKLPPVDLVVCSDAAIAKAMTPHPRSKVVCYCHSPMRYAWEKAILKEYCATMPLAARGLVSLPMALVRRADYRAAQRVDQFVANSRHVADRIRRHYGRDSIVVYPPVDLPPEPAAGPREDFYLCVGQHVRYKRLDLAVGACRKLGRKLVVIGEGPDVDRYGAREPSPKRKRGPQPLLTFLGFQPDHVVQDHYRRAKALLFPGEEDFGIVAVEAMARGCPVIAYGVGGATESVLDGTTGILFEQQTVDCLAAAIERFETMAFDAVAMHEHTLQFSKDRFLREMRQMCEQALTRAIS